MQISGGKRRHLQAMILCHVVSNYRQYVPWFGQKVLRIPTAQDRTSIVALLRRAVKRPKILHWRWTVTEAQQTDCS